MAFFQNLRLILPQICHKHGAFAIGGWEDGTKGCWRGQLPLDRMQAAAEQVLAIDALLRELDAAR